MASTERGSNSSGGHQTKMLVIAAGLPRCATSSLRTAFEEDLGLAPCMHMIHVIPSVARIKLIYQAARETDKIQRQALLHELFDGCAATSDFPGSLFVDDLLEMYPGAKLVLNKRSSPDAWYNSVSETLARTRTRSFFWMTCLVPRTYWLTRFLRAATELCVRRFGCGPFDREAYERHNDWIRRIAREKGVELLEWEPGMGYDELCRFIGRPVPLVESSSPDDGEKKVTKKFPHVNDSAVMKRIIRLMMLKGCACWAAALAVPAAACYTYLKFWRRR